MACIVHLYVSFLLVLLVTAQDDNGGIEGEHFVGLESGYDLHEFTSVLREQYQLELEEVYGTEISRILFVRGETANVLALEAAGLPQVRYVSHNQRMYKNNLCCDPPGSKNHPGLWNLDRIDQKTSLSYTDVTNGKAKYLEGWKYNQGEGVDVYVVDTGIDINHPTFEKCARWGYTAKELGTTVSDNDGHGTQVAGIIGGREYGVAKKVNLIAVKVMERNSTSADNVVAGLTWVLQEHKSGTDKSIVNLSIGLEIGINISQSVELVDMINQLFADGVSIVGSAGNEADDACKIPENNIDHVVVVGSSTINDEPALISNYGECVDIYAPGEDILTATLQNTDTRKDGTSYATAHVTGVMARYISLFKTPPTPQLVKDWVLAKANVGALTIEEALENAGTPNALLYVPCGPW